MNHELKLSYEIVLVKRSLGIEVVYIENLDLKSLSLFELVLNLEVFDELRAE